jgi:pimeloyl-ACP methyl ester carboxylesterase
MGLGMFGKFPLLVAVLAMLIVQPALADVLVLVHGYASDARTWEQSGVNDALQAHGWPRAGVVTPGFGAGMLPVAGLSSSLNKSYSVNLPAHAPLLVQSDYMRAVLNLVRQLHPDEKLILVGHSAGGVVARLAVLGNNPYRVDELITIATPNLGTVRAAQGLDVVDSKPFFCPGPGIDMLKSVFGGSDYNYLRDSRAVLVDLLPAESGNVLAWLNQQPHPDITYYSVVRQSPFAGGDEIVPAYSQDMNNVPALRGRAKVLFTRAGHALNPQDGTLLAGILAQ